MLYVDPIAESYLRGVDAAPGSEGRREAAFRELEQLFIYMLLREMRRTVPENVLFGNTPGMDFYQDLLDDALSRQMAQSGQFGIAKLLETQLKSTDAAGGPLSTSLTSGPVPFPIPAEYKAIPFTSSPTAFDLRT